MIKSIRQGTIVETLLNSLEAERYVRGALLATIADELSASGDGLEMAADAARSILERWEAGELQENEFVARVRSLRNLVQTLNAPPESGERVIAEPRFTVIAGGRASAA